MIYVVDTHALVWFFENSDELGKNAKNAFDSKGSKLIIPFPYRDATSFVFFSGID